MEVEVVLPGFGHLPGFVWIRAQDGAGDEVDVGAVIGGADHAFDVAGDRAFGQVGQRLGFRHPELVAVEVWFAFSGLAPERSALAAVK